LGLLLLGVDNRPSASSVETFAVGVASQDEVEGFALGLPIWDSVELFSIQTQRSAEVEEVFGLLGYQGASSAEPFDLGHNQWASVEEVFNIMSRTGGYLGTGSPASPRLGWLNKTGGA
jgi:hypothetical protein